MNAYIGRQQVSCFVTSLTPYFPPARLVSRPLPVLGLLLQLALLYFHLHAYDATFCTLVTPFFLVHMISY